jgi:hypothetical protein
VGSVSALRRAAISPNEGDVAGSRTGEALPIVDDGDDQERTSR